MRKNDEKVISLKVKSADVDQFKELGSDLKIEQLLEMFIQRPAAQSMRNGDMSPITLLQESGANVEPIC